FAGADAAEGKGVEHHDDLASTELRQGHVLAVLVLQGEIGRDGAHLDRGHGHLLWVDSLVATQPSPTAFVVVIDNPAIGAASPMSAPDTWPSRPTFGVNSHTKPPSATSCSESTRASVRSPSSARHQ